MIAVSNRIVLVSVMLLAATGLIAGDKDKPQTGKLEPKVVDSGSFGIYLDGKRVGTEKFKIEQRSDYSVASAEIKLDDGKNQAEQAAEMEVAPNGDLRSYTWRATVPTHEESSVEPKDQLLLEHIVPADQKKIDMPHILPVSTAILDDNFFSQREVLMWRYLATACIQRNKQLACGPGSYGVLVPHQHAAFSASVELKGMDKVEVKPGVVRELNKIVLTTADPQQLAIINAEKDTDSEWVIWVDDQYKMIKISIPGSRVEVIRD